MLAGLKRQRTNYNPNNMVGQNAYTPPLSLGVRVTTPLNNSITEENVQNLEQVNISSEKFNLNQFLPVPLESLSNENTEFLQAKLKTPISQLPRNTQGRYPLVEPIESLEKQRDISWLGKFKQLKIASPNRNTRKGRKQRKARKTRVSKRK